MSAVTGPDGRPLRVLHVLALSSPHLNGYTVRSKYLVDAQRRAGLDPFVITSPYYSGNDGTRGNIVLDGTPYVRVPHPLDGGRLEPERVVFRVWQQLERARRVAGAVKRLGHRAAENGSRRPTANTHDFFRDHVWAATNHVLMRRFERGLRDAVVRIRPDIIHAHSPFRCGLPGLRVARRSGIPFVYEVRGIWEESAVASEGKAIRDTRFYRWWRESETTVMTGADTVVCICEQLRREVIDRGVPEARVVVVPNAVDASVFHPGSARPDHAPDEVRAVRQRLSGFTVGYVGSLRRLEGVDELVRGVAEMVRRGRDVSLLVVGGGDVEELMALAERLGIGHRSVFTGQVPHDRVAFYYDMLDAFVISRPARRVTELVTPLKPLEAMAMKKPLIVSDLPALRELVNEGRTGLTYTPGDIGGLADQCARLQDDDALRRRLSEAALKWVLEERSWPKVLQQLYPAYGVLSARR